LKISFSYQYVKFRVKEAGRTKAWIISTAEMLGLSSGVLQFNFVTRNRILEINKTFLKHNYITDIISFSYPGEDNSVSAEFYICPWQVKQNARNYGVKIEEEIRRVLVHGLLHCAGYHDLTRAEIRAMREAENLYLDKF
jgi:probable rRNA maturation factor